MDRTYVLSKSRFAEFFKKLQELGEVNAPVRVSEKSFSFRKVEKPEQIAFEALRTILPPKKFFYPQEETIIKWENGEFKECVNEQGFQVIFGIHPCDLAGLGIMDTIYTAEPQDSHYVRRRQNSFLVGLSCMPDKHCFCQSMESSYPKSGYDIFLTDINESFFIEARTPAGLNLLQSMPELLKAADDADKASYKQFWNTRAEAFTNGFKAENLPSLVEMEWDSPLWKDLGERCLSCGNCTPVCPTCYCFDLVDIAHLNGQEGERRRQWDSCQFVGFAKVAGEYNFRPTPVDRLKFWYKHKLHGFDDPYGFKTCVGCGRCTESCPSGIDDIVQVVKVLQGKKEKYEAVPYSAAGPQCGQREEK